MAMNRNVSTMSKNVNFVGDPLLHRISGIVSSAMTLKEMLDELIGLVLGVTNCDACLVYLLEEAAGEIVLCASQLPHAGEIGNIRLKIGEGVTGWVAQHRSPVALTSHAAADPRFKAFTSLPEDTYEAFLSVPLISGGGVIGVINIHHKRPHGGAISKASLLEQNAKLMAETLEMKRLLGARKVIERAKGILQRWHGMTEEEAYMDLRSQSRRLRRPMQELADAIILADELHRKSERKAQG
ncbi:MAG: sensory transcriptional regulator [Acidobacteria bacterium]|nr:MAG: sensory transcriptional regulator [Acidobacteriota bacterium]